MGVPTFYRWLCNKWPKTVVDCVEEMSEYNADGTFVPVRTTEPNPSGIEFDNLYLDMNGIIHPCAHPETISEQPETEEEMFLNVMTYVDRLFNCVRPRKLLFMAIDGVAPRAKMNQQRLRRFKAALFNKDKRKKYEALRAQFEAEGREVPPFGEKWDHNVITPGTPFMARLAEAIRFYIKERMTNDPAWRNITVIFSDASMPGEGEHKIMQYIRDQRCKEGYDWNMTHCVYGMDADLIMLALATHESRFYIIREEVKTEGKDGEQEKTCGICQQKGHWASDCNGQVLDDMEKAMELAAKGLVQASPPSATIVEATGPMAPGVDYNTTSKSSRAFKSSWARFQFLSIPILREYLAAEFSFDGMKLLNSHFVDLERCIDDFLLMCFFVGNDFLPHLPALSIHKGSIDQMLLLYKKMLPELGDYLTDQGCVNYSVLKTFCQYLALSESEILQNDFKKLNIRKNREKENKRRVEEARSRRKTKSYQEDASDASRAMTQEEHHNFFNQKMKTELAAEGTVDPDEEKNREGSRTVQLGGEPMSIYRPRYYRAKLKLPLSGKDEVDNDPEVESAACATARAYVTGISWVLQYYLQGTINWEWYYPFHYAPFTVDIVKYGLIGPRDPQCTYSIDGDDFEPSKVVQRLKDAKSEPFTPFEQLLGVLPVQSKHALPPSYQEIMKDVLGPICDVYPDHFHEDPDGKKHSWQWIPLLPFIDAKRLISVGQKALELCNEEDRMRNRFGEDKIYRHADRTAECMTMEYSPVPAEAYTRYACYPWPRALPQGPMCHEEVLIHPPRQLHVSSLGKGVIRPDPVLTPADLEIDDADQSKNKGFNSIVAKRIIMNTLALKGMVSQDEAQKFEDPRFVNRRGYGGGHQVSRHGNIRHQGHGNVALGAVDHAWQDGRRHQHQRPDAPQTEVDANLAIMDEFAKTFRRDR